MTYSEKLAAFKKFAEEKGYKIKGSVVDFDTDEAAATAFADEAQCAGFDVSKDSNQASWDAQNVTKSPVYWFVTLKAQ